MRRGLSTRRSGWGWGCVCVCDIYLGKWKTGGIFHPRCRHLIRVLNLWGVHVARVPSGFFYYYYSYYFERQLQQLLPSRVTASAAARFISLHKSSTFGGKWQRPQSRQNCVDDFLTTSTIMGTSESFFFFYIHIGNYQGREMTVFVFFLLLLYIPTSTRKSPKLSVEALWLVSAQRSGTPRPLPQINREPRKRTSWFSDCDCSSSQQQMCFQVLEWRTKPCGNVCVAR